MNLNELKTRFELKTSPHAHIELEFDVLGVAGNLMKYIICIEEKN
jgi:hypothetical protein